MAKKDPSKARPADEPKYTRWRGWLLIAGIALMGSAITLSISYTSYEQSRKTKFVEAQSRMADLVGRIQSEMNIHMSSVRAFRALFDVSDTVTRDAFSSYANSLKASAAGIIAYGWAPRKRGVDPDEFAARTRSLGFNDENSIQALADAVSRGVRPLAKKYPVAALEPSDVLFSLFGSDLAEIPSIVSPLQDSIDFDEVQLSDPLSSLNTISYNSAVMLLYPHFKHGARNFLVDQRRKNVIGVVFAILDLDTIISFAVQSISIDALVQNNAVAIDIKSRDSENQASSIFQTSNFADLSGRGEGTLFDSIMDADRIFYLGNRPVRLRMLIDLNVFDDSGYKTAIATFIIGMLLTISACQMVYLMVSREQRVQALVVDRTQALKVSERRIQDMADVSADWFWETDEDLRFVYLSERFEQVTGLQPELFMNRTRVEAAGIDIYDIDDSWRAHLDALESRSAFTDFRYTMPKGNGKVKFLSISGKPVFAENGKFLGYRGSGRDVTVEERAQHNLKESESRLHRYVEELEVSRQYLEENTAEIAELAEQYAIEKDRAEASEKSKSEFLASMSHEIRTPMTGVMGFADMLLDSNLAKEDREKVIKIKSATQSLLTIINDILDLSKLEAGRLEMENLDFNLRYTIEEVLDLVRERAKAKNINLRMVYPRDIPDGINGDPTRIRQILINLIGNAVKFTHIGEVTVEVQLDGDDEHQMLRVSVVDTGIGISGANSEKLFVDFTQADASISRRYEGTGLGLSISKRLIELMKGVIWVDSQEGVGSNFSFRLPYIPATSDVSAKLRQNVVQNFSTERSLHILVAEDNRLNQRIIVATLEKFGHKPTVVENGVQVLSEIERQDYDLILMDIRMPEMNGLEATRAIRSRSDALAKIPIVALTADAMEEHIRGYLADGMDACATKPIDRAELLMTINEVLDEEVHVVQTALRDSNNEGGLKAERSNLGADNGNDKSTASVMDFLDQIGNVANEIEREKQTKP